MGRKSKAVVRRQEILSHFYQVIIEEGFEGASIAKIAKRMEVNPSLLIHYFSTKEAMVLGLIEYIISTYSSHILPDFSQEEDPVQRWEDVLDVVSQIQWDRIISNVVFYSCYTLALRNPDIRSQFSALYERIAKTIEEEIIFASQANVIQVKEPAKAAEMIVTLFEGTNFYQHVRPSEEEQEGGGRRASFLRRTIIKLIEVM